MESGGTLSDEGGAPRSVRIESLTMTGADSSDQVNPAMVSGAVSHVGGIRTMNEDSYLTSDRVCLVADGMGGHEAGEVASGLAAELFERTFGLGILDVGDLEPLFTSINRQIRQVGVENGTEGMGTTVVGLGLIANGDTVSAVVFNVGDSRCYRLLDGKLEQLTTDHSHVQELITAGELSAADASRHPMKNVVTRALGVEREIRADYTLLDEVSCRLLLCSDGLSGEISDERIREILSSEADPQAAATALVESVLEGRAPDNVTAVVVDVTFDDVVDDITVPNDRRPTDIEITAPRPLPPPESRTHVFPAPTPSDGGSHP